MKNKTNYLVLLLVIAVTLTGCDAAILRGSDDNLADQDTSSQVDSPLLPESEESTPASNSTSADNEEGSDSSQYLIVDTGQDHCYSDTSGIPCPLDSENYYGQDAQYQGYQFSYQDNSDGTITDLITGLMWQKNPDLDHKSTYAEAISGAGTFSLAGHEDWRLPTIKELYSLIDFSGSSRQSIPYLDTNYFSFRFGDESRGERQIDAQYWSSTEYVGTTMNGNKTVFGVNFADGRIKGYPALNSRDGQMTQFVRYVRGNPDYGLNEYTDNNDGTITDNATGLIWQSMDSVSTLNWEDSLAYCENLDYGGFTDWRLPNAKELQSILDYSQSPQTSNSAAIDPLFIVTEVESWYWSSTTHLDNDTSNAVYLAFGQAFGLPNGNLVDVHGAGAQRSDPKSGDPANYSEGRGTEGQDDQIRIYNYARCVRGGATSEILIGGQVDSQSDAIGNQTNHDQEPPPEAVNACDDLDVGMKCSFSPPGGDISGSCQIVKSNILACVPEGGPPPR